MRDRIPGVLFGVYRGSMRHKLIHSQTRFERAASRLGIEESTLRNTYSEHYAHCYSQAEFLRYVVAGKLSPDGREFTE